MEWFELIIKTAHQDISCIEGVLCMCGVTGWAIEDKNDLEEFLQNNRELWDYVDQDLLKSENVRIKVYLPDNAQGRDTLSNIKDILAYHANERGLTARPILTVGSVNEQDWANNWKKYFKPLEIGNRLTICPEWEEYKNENRKILRIDPGSAFGTGGHATTRLCLEFIDQLVKGGESVLDIGTGSGILASASVLLGAQSALGADIDENSVNIARSTAQLNGLTGCVFRQTDLAGGITGKYDIVLANIVADIVMRLAPNVPSLLAQGGVFISSGIIDERLEEVKACLTDIGFDIIQIKEAEGWAAIMAAMPNQNRRD